MRSDSFFENKTNCFVIREIIRNTARVVLQSLNRWEQTPKRHKWYVCN